MNACVLSCSVVSDCEPLDCNHQVPLSMGFSRKEYWSGLPFPFPGDLPHPGIELKSPVSPALAGRFFITFVYILLYICIYIYII